jgi:iron complex outermembrane receptor protein
MNQADAVRLLCGGYVAYGLLLHPASAQGAAGTQPQPETGPGRLEEIIVTAERREASIQDTPLAVSAMTSEVIEQRGITNVSTLSALVPNLAVTTTPASSTSSTIYIRGIGSGEPVLTNDAPVSLYVDGVVVGRQTGAEFDLVELERVEVLRGPQGTLYGRNTIGGAVNLITAKPADEFGFRQKLSYGSWNQWQARSTLDTGEWGKSGIRAKLSYAHQEQDGYVDDLTAPGDVDPGAFELDAVRVALGFDRKGPFRADYAFDYNNRDSIAPAFQATVLAPPVAALLNSSPAFGGAAPLVSTDRLDKVRFDDEGLITDKVSGHTLRLEFDLGDETLLRSLTGYRKWENVNRGDELDGQAGIRAFTVSPAILAPPYAFIPTGVQTISLFTSTNERDQDQWSQEIDLIGNIGERIDYVAGVFYFTEDAYERNPQFPTIAIPMPPPLPPAIAVPIQALLDYDHGSDSQAAFGQVTYDLTDRLSLTGGLRYTRDEKHLVQRSPYVRDFERSFDQWNWSATLDYAASDEVMSYLRIATGYKAGGFNARSSNAGFDPEDLTSYEVGVKSELFDRRLRLNAAAFYVEHEDLQVQQFQAGSGGAISVTVNAGKANYMGVEVEFDALLAQGLTLSGALGYIDREYDEFLILDPATNTIVDVADSARFTYAADTTASVSMQYAFPRFDLGQFSARLEYNYRGKVYFYPTLVGTPMHEQIAGDGRGLLDARVTLAEIAIGGADASLAIWGRNLADEQYRVHGIDFGGLGFAGNVYGEPRSAGVDFTIAF